MTRYETPAYDTPTKDDPRTRYQSIESNRGKGNEEKTTDREGKQHVRRSE